MTARLPDTALGLAAHAFAAAPSIVAGAVMHRRSRPVRNAFRYPAFCLRIPLTRVSELDALGVRHNRTGLVSFHDRDLGPGDGMPLAPFIAALLEGEGIASDGPIVLYTFPRMLGYVFNPVSFFVCHGPDGNVRAIVAEVNNTFGERHRYVLAPRDGGSIRGGQLLHAHKSFHVSPFCEVAGHYAFRFRFGATRFLARIDYFDDASGESAPLLETAFGGEARPLPRWPAGALLWRYRWFTLGVIARIHWQAARLWWKRVPHFAKPAPPAHGLTRGG